MKLRMEAMSKPGGEVRKPCCAIWSRVELVMVKKEALSRGGGETVREPDLQMEGEVEAGRPEMLTSSPKARMSWSMSLVLEEEGWGGEGISSLGDFPDMVDGRWEPGISAMGRESQNEGCKTPFAGFLPDWD